VGPSGNVYSWEAVDELNIKRRNWKDLLSDEPFKRKDLIHIQDPQNPPDIRWTDYHHIKQAKAEEAENTKETPNTAPKPTPADTKYNGGFTCAGFTGDPEKELTEAEKPGMIVKERAYVQLLTNLGPLNLELRSDLVPKACENFIGLCKKNYYNGTTFHRNIPGFMIQGGDPTGTGTGGTSIWNEKFFDEFKQQLPHSGRGILSMANAGPKTNGSQFFILYKAQAHLNNKHTVFGSVVGGMETLDKMESVPTDDKDVPTEEIQIIKTSVFKDPFEEKREYDAQSEERAKQQEEDNRMGRWYSDPKGNHDQAFKEGVGKYIDPSRNRSAKRERSALDFGAVTAEERKTKSPRTTKFSW